MGDLFQLSVLPKVVCVIEGWKGPDPEATVETNDILIVKGFKRKINHKFLKVISLKSKEKKELPEICAGIVVYAEKLIA